MSRFVLVRAQLSLSMLMLGALATAAPIPEAETASEAVVLDVAAPVATVAPETLSTPIAAADPDPSVSTAPAALVGPPPPRTLRPMAFEYSDGYYTRLKIHKYASFATLPIFAAQFVVGQKLYNGTGSSGTRSLHQGLVGATAALFTVNVVTGAWNIYEARKDPNHKTKRTVHGVLMVVAEAGFVTTGVLTPEHERNSGTGLGVEGGGTSRSTHRTLALVSMGVATVSYLMMLFH